MDTYVLFALLGLGAGAVYAGLALGVVLGYRGSGVINFAHGAMAMYVTYVYAGLRTDGRYLIPPIPNPLAIIEGIAGLFGAELDLPSFPTFVSLGGAMSFWPAFLLAVATAALLGLGVHLLVFRPLRSAPTLAKVVAAVGLMIVLQAVIGLRYGTDVKSVPQTLPNSPVEVLGASVPRDRFVLTALVLAAAALLFAVYRFTTFGLATQAASENEKGASISGLSPDRLAAANWILATVLAGIAGILIAPITALTPNNFTLFIIPALGAALIGAFRSFSLAAGAGLSIGVLQSLVLPLQQDLTWLPRTGLQQGLPFIVIVLAMIWRGNSLPSRGAILSGRLPFAPRPTNVGPWAAVLIPLVLVALVVLPFDYRSAIINSLVFITISLSLVVLTGYVGQISLAQMALAGASAFLLSRLAGSAGIPFPIAPLLAALGATALGVVASLPALRTRGVNLAVITLAGGYALQEMVFNNPELVTTGSGSRVPAPALGGVSFGQNDPFFGESQVPNPAFGMFVLAVVVLCCLGVVNLRRSATGRRLLAVRSNERAAAAAGIDVARTKVVGFAISGFLAGIGGTLIGYQFEGVSANQFLVLISIAVLATTYLGGISSVSGAILAGTLALGGWAPHLADEIFHTGPWELMISGFALILTAIFNPEGISGAMRHTWADIRRKRSAKLDRTPERRLVSTHAA